MVILYTNENKAIRQQRQDYRGSAPAVDTETAGEPRGDCLPPPVFKSDNRGCAGFGGQLIESVRVCAGAIVAPHISS